METLPKLTLTAGLESAQGWFEKVQGQKEKATHHNITAFVNRVKQAHILATSTVAEVANPPRNKQILLGPADHPPFFDKIPGIRTQTDTLTLHVAGEHFEAKQAGCGNPSDIRRIIRNPVVFGTGWVSGAQIRSKNPVFHLDR